MPRNRAAMVTYQMRSLIARRARDASRQVRGGDKAMAAATEAIASRRRASFSRAEQIASFLF